MSTDAAAFVYRPPDGGDDAPDAQGRHTRTVNVLHSALESARFPGCEQCRSLAESEARSHNEGRHSHYDPQTGESADHSVAECPAGWTPPDWRDGQCNCPVCQRRRAILGY